MRRQTREREVSFVHRREGSREEGRSESNARLDDFRSWIPVDFTVPLRGGSIFNVRGHRNREEVGGRGWVLAERETIESESSKVSSSSLPLFLLPTSTPFFSFFSFDTSNRTESLAPSLPPSTMPSSDQLWGEDLELDEPTLARLSQLEASTSTSSTSSSSSSSHTARMADITSASTSSVSALPSGSSTFAASRLGHVLERRTRREEEEENVEQDIYPPRNYPDAPPAAIAPPLPSGPFMNAVLQSTSYNPIPNAHLAAAGPSNSQASNFASPSSSRTVSPEVGLPLRPLPSPRINHPRPSLSPATDRAPFLKKPRLRRGSSTEEEHQERGGASGGSRSSQLNLPSFPLASSSPSFALPNLQALLSTSSSSESPSTSTLDKGKGKARAISPASIPNLLLPVASTSNSSSSSSSSSTLLQPKPEPTNTTVDEHLLLSNKTPNSQRTNPSPPSSKEKGKGKGKERAPLFSEEDFECSICQDLTVGTSSIVPCGHSFCGGCIWDYLKAGNSTCPICRTEVPSHGTRIVPNYVAENLLSKWAEVTLNEEEKKEWVSRKDGWLGSVSPSLCFV
ncbi:hypothetical protein BDY24DRAFT_186749 [Mrakia frigida]|uniref:uncharacterized protein n=1 Tax=Mrakia frigida TaxID=29902 RepID=UPI003FCC079E